MADRINVRGAASALKNINSDYQRMNSEIQKMLDNLKYLQDSFHDLEGDVCSENYQNISQSVYDSNGLIEVTRRVHKWCQQVDAFVEAEERRIEQDKREAEEQRRALLNSARSRRR